MKAYLFALLAVAAFSVQASERAVTEQGRVVILDADGTWQYENSAVAVGEEIKTNDAEFKRDAKSVFSVKSTKNSAEFWVDPKEWSFEKKEDGGDVEYQFRLKDEDLYGMVVSEQIQMDLKNLADVAFGNVKSAAPDAKIMKQEYRMVNGLRVLYMETRGTIKGIDFTYLGYYHSGEGGTSQYVAYTGTNLVARYRGEIDRFLNGFSVRK